MNVKSLLELKERIDEDLAWRKKELTAIKLDVESSMTKSDSEQSRAIRAGIIFLYAHWEGSIKTLAEYYLIYVSNLHLKHNELKSNFLAIEIKSLLAKLMKTKKATLYGQMIDEIFAKKNESSDIPYKNVITTNSNLKMETFQQIMTTIGIEGGSYDLKKILIDERLLKNRNKVAHGERIDQLYGITTPSDYIGFHTEIVSLISKFADDIMNAAEKELYKK